MMAATATVVAARKGACFMPVASQVEPLMEMKRRRSGENLWRDSLESD